MSIKAVVIDMDGTLLNTQHRISDYTADVLRKIREKGICFVVATGRPYADVFLTMRDAHLEPDYIITSNGARIHDSALKVVREHNMRPELVEGVLRLRKARETSMGDVPINTPKKIGTNIYRNADWLTDRCIPHVKEALHKDLECTDLRDRLFGLEGKELEGVHEVWFLGDRDELKLFATELDQKFPNELCLTFSLPHLLDCVPVGVNKGNGVREVAEVLGLTLDEVACFGDGMNDESMLQITKTSFIMENGQQGLKDAVPHAQVIGTNDADSVAKKLEEMFLSR